MKIHRLAAVGVALLLPFVAAACGGSDDTNSGSRPSASELAKAFKSAVPAGLSTEQSDKFTNCLGQKLEDSDLPNGVLRSIAAGEKKTNVDSGNKAKYETIITDASKACAQSLISGG